jgi:hypothetical protein
MNHTQSETEKLPSSRIHVLGAFFAAVAMGIFLALAPSCGRAFRERQIQAIQLGAKTDLLWLFEQQKKFRAEFGFFTTDLNRLGIAPKHVLYKFGFTVPGDVREAGVEPETRDLDRLKASLPKLEMNFSPVTKLASIDFDSLVGKCPDCTASRDTFKAIAVANLDQDDTLDVWTIDQAGSVTHVTDDLSSNH